MNGNAMISNEKPNNLARRIFIISFFIIGALSIILIITLVITSATPKYENTGGDFDYTYYKYDNLSEILNLYNNLPDEMPEDYLYTILEEGEISRDYVQIDTESGEGYITTIPIGEDTDFSTQNIEFISFRYTPGDEESAIATIDNIAFNSYRNGRYDSIQSTAESEYTHYGNEYTNSYENKSYAIDSYLMTL